MPHFPPRLLAASFLLLAPPLAAQGLNDYVCRWSFDDGAGGVVTDSGPHGFHGTLPAGGTWVPGLLGTALELDGLGQYVEITDGNGYPDLLAGLTEGTISVFFRVDSAPPMNEIHPLLYFGDGVGGPGQSGLILEIGHFGTSTKAYFTVFDDNGHIPQCFDTGFDVTIGQWHQFAVVVGPSGNTGYLDGVELVDRHYNFGTMSDNAFFATVLDPQVMWLGRGKFAYFPEDQWLDGALEELRIWDRPLSAAEIAQHYFDVTGASGVRVSVQAPADGEVLWGPQVALGTATGAASVEVAIDGGPWRPAAGTAQWSFAWDAAALGAGPHELQVRALGPTGAMAADLAWPISSPDSPPPPDCGAIVAGSAIAGANPLAPPRVPLPAAPATVEVVILGADDCLGFADELQTLLAADPPGGRSYQVVNRAIAGEELWSWAAPGGAGWQAVEDLVNNLTGPTVVLAQMSNAASYPIAAPGPADPNYARYVAECGQLADHLHAGGSGVDAVWFTGPRMDPNRLMPCWYENLAVADVLADAAAAGRDFVRAGAEQHQLHWCSFPAAYDSAFTGPSAAGEQLLAEAWFGILKKELTGSFELDADPLVAGAAAGVRVNGAAPDALTWLGISPSGLGSFAVPALGVVLDLESPMQAGLPQRTDALGTAVWSFVLPPASAGRRYWAQALQNGGTSNVVERLVQ